MQALFVVLNKVDYLDEILANFVGAGVTGATILDSQGMAGAMVDADAPVPVFGFLKTFMNDSKPYSKTIFTVLEDQEMVEKVVSVIKKTLGDDAKNGSGFMFSVPLSGVYPMED